MKGYIVISAMEDGSLAIREYSRDEFEAEANKGPDGLIGAEPSFLDMKGKDTLYSENLHRGDVIVIKGEIVIPRAVQVVKTFKLER